jgi:hypothetical protein
MPLNFSKKKLNLETILMSLNNTMIYFSMGKTVVGEEYM